MTTSFEVIAGDPASPVVIHVPHASRDIPDDVRAGIVLDDTALERELDALTDAFTDVIAERAAERSGLRPWIVVNRLSRLVVDPERFPDDREELADVGMGAVYTRTSRGEVLRETDDEVPGLVDRFFTPYAEAFTALVDERLAAVGTATIIDLHSYPLVPNPYELHADGPRPALCLGTDAFHTPPVLLDGVREAAEAEGLDVATDSPFIGCYVPLKHYRTDDRVRAIMLEIRRDLYLRDGGGYDDAGVSRLGSIVAHAVTAATFQQRLFAVHPVPMSLMHAFGAESPEALAAVLRREAGVPASLDLDVFDLDGELSVFVGDTGRRIGFPTSMFELVDLVDHVRHLEEDA